MRHCCSGMFSKTLTGFNVAFYVLCNFILITWPPFCNGQQGLISNLTALSDCIRSTSESVHLQDFCRLDLQASNSEISLQLNRMLTESLPLVNSNACDIHWDPLTIAGPYSYRVTSSRLRVNVTTRDLFVTGLREASWGTLNTTDWESYGGKVISGTVTIRALRLTGTYILKGFVKLFRRWHRFATGAGLLRSNLKKLETRFKVYVRSKSDSGNAYGQVDSAQLQMDVSKVKLNLTGLRPNVNFLLKDRYVYRVFKRMRSQLESAIGEKVQHFLNSFLDAFNSYCHSTVVLGEVLS